VNDKHLKDIIDGCRKGKRRSQEMLYHHYSGKMFAVCLYYGGNKTEAEDFLHNGFIKVFQNIKQYNAKGVFDAWMRRIFMNTALEKYRDKKQLFISHEKEELQMLESDQEDALSKISAADLINLIQELSPAYRMVFNLFAIEGYSHKEISVMLSISEGTSKSNLSRARAVLQQQVNERFDLSRSKG
jgi:RNA polymerase sigma factor (sigma-70 family)